MVPESKEFDDGYYKGLVDESPQSAYLKREVQAWMKTILNLFSGVSREVMVYKLSEAAALSFDLYSSERAKPHWLKPLAKQTIEDYFKEEAEWLIAEGLNTD